MIKDLFNADREQISGMFEEGILEPDFITSVQLLTSKKIDKKIPLTETLCVLLKSTIKDNQEPNMSVDDINNFFKKYKACKSNTDRMIILSELCRKISLEELVFCLQYMLVPSKKRPRSVSTVKKQPANSKKSKSEVSDIISNVVNSGAKTLSKDTIVNDVKSDDDINTSKDTTSSEGANVDSESIESNDDTDSANDKRYNITAVVVGGKIPSLVQQQSKKFQKHNYPYTSFGIAVRKDDKYKLIGSLRYCLNVHNLNKFNKLKCEPSNEYALTYFNIEKSKYVDHFFSQYDFKVVDISCSGINKNGELKKIRLDKIHNKFDVDKIITLSEIKVKLPKK